MLTASVWPAIPLQPLTHSTLFAGSTTGNATFTYTVTDADTLLNSTATVTLVVGAVAPVAADDVFGCPYKVDCVVADPGLLGNDATSNGGTLQVVGTPVVSAGTLRLASNGSFVYTPPR